MYFRSSLGGGTLEADGEGKLGRWFSKSKRFGGGGNESFLGKPCVVEGDEVFEGEEDEGIFRGLLGAARDDDGCVD